MIYIFFIYGLSFFSFGLALLLYPKEVQGVKFVKHIWSIGAFGIIHGINEWIDMFKSIDHTYEHLFGIAGFIILPLSFLFLLYFALVTIAEENESFASSYIIPIIIVFVLLFLIVSFQYDDVLLAGNVWARYLLGVPGIFMSAYVLFMQRDKASIYMFASARNYLLVFCLTLVAYGVLSGIIVPKAPIYLATVVNQTVFQESFGIPVQFFRAMCALLAAYTVIASLKILRRELQTQLIKLSKAIDVSGDSVVITDKDGLIQYVNPAFEEESGFTVKEVIGKKSSILKSGVHNDAFYEKFWAHILSGEIFRGYFVNKKKNGELFHEYKAIAPICNAKGVITNFVSTGKDVTERILLEKKLEQLASTDKLTELANRMKFDEVIQQCVDRAKRYNRSLSLILFDIDNFKKINDVYGHVIGDEVLKKIAKIGQKNVRKSDLIARWGGEEFMVIQPDIPESEAFILANRLREEIESYTFDDIGNITASFGVTTFRKSDSIDSFLTRVDEALYTAKKTGKNRIVQI